MGHPCGRRTERNRAALTRFSGPRASRNSRSSEIVPQKTNDGECCEEMSMIRPSDPEFRICLVDFNTLIEMQSDAERLGFATRWTSVDALRGQVKEQDAVLQTFMRERRAGVIRSYRCLLLFSALDGAASGGWRQSTSILHDSNHWIGSTGTRMSGRRSSESSHWRWAESRELRRSSIAVGNCWSRPFPGCVADGDKQSADVGVVDSRDGVAEADGGVDGEAG
jgi:hypothetical protein